jgi:hypothetical protein
MISKNQPKKKGQNGDCVNYGDCLNGLRLVTNGMVQ